MYLLVHDGSYKLHVIIELFLETISPNRMCWKYYSYPQNAVESSLKTIPYYNVREWIVLDGD